MRCVPQSVRTSGRSEGVTTEQSSSNNWTTFLGNWIRGWNISSNTIQTLTQVVSRQWNTSMGNSRIYYLI